VALCSARPVRQSLPPLSRTAGAFRFHMGQQRQRRHWSPPATAMDARSCTPLEPRAWLCVSPCGSAAHPLHLSQRRATLPIFSHSHASSNPAPSSHSRAPKGLTTHIANVLSVPSHRTVVPEPRINAYAAAKPPFR
jgi:hypothetical protein